MDFLAVDPLAVLLAAVAMFVIVLLWQRLVMGKPVPLSLVVPAAVLTLVAAYALGLVIGWSGVRGPVPGGILGFVAALGLIAPAQLQLTLFEKRPVTLFRLGMIHILIEMTLAGAILGGWR